MEGSTIRARGLICAGGEATRLQELTRITNKHLLPVGRWPMVYYPLQLMQRLGIRDVLVVTGQGHAGDFIDLLGDGRVGERDGDGLLFDLDLTYKVQTEPGGIAQVVGMAESFAAGESLVVCLGDNIFENVETEAVSAWAADPSGALVFVKEVPDPERFGVVVFGENGAVTDVVEKAGVVDTRYDSPPSSDAVVGLYCYPPDVFEIIRGLAPSSRGELEITDVNRAYAEQGRLRASRISGWWRDAGTHEALGRIGTLIDETGANKQA
jgi:glucose-1-phosphate thymidylyltransferase